MSDSAENSSAFVHEFPFMVRYEVTNGGYDRNGTRAMLPLRDATCSSDQISDSNRRFRAHRSVLCIRGWEIVLTVPVDALHTNRLLLMEIKRTLTEVKMVYKTPPLLEVVH